MIIRDATPDDYSAITALNDLAFGETAQSDIILNLRASGDALFERVAEDAGAIRGHVLFYRVLCDGQETVTGLGPICIHPDHQKSRIGGALIKDGLNRVNPDRHKIVFLLGHTSYYPRFGFRSDIGARFVSPWPRPAFMGLELSTDAPQSGTLTFPDAYL